MRALLAEDDESVRTVCQLILNRFYPDILLDTVEDGFALLEMGRTYSYDLILSDDNMPRLNGLEAIAQLKSEGKFKGRAGLLTTVKTPEREAQMIEHEIIYLPKPLNIAKLRGFVDEALKEYAS